MTLDRANQISYESIQPIMTNKLFTFVAPPRGRAKNASAGMLPKQSLEMRTKTYYNWINR